MSNKNPSTPAGVLRTGKAGKIAYWIATIWLALGMLSTGLVQMFKAKEGQGGVDMITHLGYPVYLLTLLAVWKILGVIALLIPGFSLLKEWAYAGFFFIMSGAVYSHIAASDGITEILASLLLLILTMVSWYFRPANRKVVSVKPTGTTLDEKKTSQESIAIANN